MNRFIQTFTISWQLRRVGEQSIHFLNRKSLILINEGLLRRSSSATKAVPWRSWSLFLNQFTFK